MQIPELLAQRKFVCHAHSNAHKPPKTVAPSVLMRELTEMYCSHQYLSIDPKKVCQAHFNAHKPPTNLKKSLIWTSKYLENYQR